MRLSRAARRMLWVLCLVSLALTFAVAGRGDGKPPTNAERVEALARQFACPECNGQSVASSNAAAAQNIHSVVAQMVGEGRTDGEIRALIVDRFGEEVSLVPSSGGFVALVWVIPIVVAIVAVAALGAVMWRWRRSVGSDGTASLADRQIVEEFLAERDAVNDSGVRT